MYLATSQLIIDRSALSLLVVVVPEAVAP